MGYNLEKLRFVFEIIAFRSQMRKHFVLRIIQCECVLFPHEEADVVDNWLLFIETKYAKDEIKARDERNNYPQKMVGQIEATVEYFRNKGILEENKVVYAIVSFPMLDNYNAWFDQNLIHEALAKHRIIVRATNQAKILSKQVIQL